MPAEDEKQNIENENNKTSDELLDLKKELATHYFDDLKKELGFFKKIIIAPIESNMKKVISGEINEPETISDIFESDNDGFFDKAVNSMKKQWGSLFISHEFESTLLSFMKEKRNEIENKTKPELESLKLTIMQQNHQNNQSNQKPQSNQNGRTTNQGNNNGTHNSGTSSYSSTHTNIDNHPYSYQIDLFNINVSPETKRIWENLKGKEKPDLEPFACAMKAYKTEKAAGHIKNPKYVTVIDFTKNQQTQNRFFVINLNTNTVEYAEKCGHGEGSGGSERATSFSNEEGSHQSSLGAFTTADHSQLNSKRTWEGNFGEGLEQSNSNLNNRGCAIHPVYSLTYRNSGKSTSEGCFTIPKSQAYVNEILNKIQGGSLVFAYAKSKDYFAQSNYFQQNPDGSVTA